MEVWVKDKGTDLLGNQWMIYLACLCPGADPNIDDGCKFANPSSPSNPGSCGGGSCCKLFQGYILEDGSNGLMDG